MRDTISSNSEISDDEMEENSSISSEEEELEYEGKIIPASQNIPKTN